MEKPTIDKEKIQQLDFFMKELIEATDKYKKREIYNKYEKYIQFIKPIDLFYLNMYKRDTNYSIEAIKENADKFVNVFYHGLSSVEKTSYDHIFFNSLLTENKAMEDHLNTLKKYFKKNQIDSNKEKLIKGFELCLQFEKKFVKKENILFPHLEKVLPSTMPLQIIWTLHDDSRKLIKELLVELKKPLIDEDEFFFLIGQYYYLIFGLNIKDQLILFPVAEMVLSKEILNKIYVESFEYGYALSEIKPDSTFFKDIEETVFKGEFKTKTGSLSLKEIDLIFSYLPLDITFVDKDNKVKYFNNRKERHFPRNPSVIGRLVKHCHPPKSVKIVEEIIDAFKEGKKDFAEFWITMNDVMLYITYAAVRDESNNYLGILEISQDITNIRALEGNKRLLDW